MPIYRYTFENKTGSTYIFNVGIKRYYINSRMGCPFCYHVVGKQTAYEYVYGDIEQRNYFCFYDYEYYLDVSEQYKLMHDVKPISVGLREAFDWYKGNAEKVNRKPYLDYIDKNIR